MATLKIIKKSLQRLRRFGVRRKLSGQLGTRMFSPCEQSQGALAQRVAHSTLFGGGHRLR